MNPSVNHDVKGVMAAISNGDVSLELARRKIAWLDLLPFPMHADADAKRCLNFIKKQNLSLYVRLISAMARLHHAFFDALGGLDNVCVIAQSSIVGGSKSKNVFKHFFAEVEEHCDSSLSFGPIDKFGFKAHPCSFLTGLYPGLEGLERTDAEIAYAYALVFGEYVKVNMGASAVAKNGDGWAATQANRSVQGKKRGKKNKDDGLGIFKLVPDPKNPGVMTTHSSLNGRKCRDENTGMFKLVPDPKKPGEMTTIASLNKQIPVGEQSDAQKAANGPMEGRTQKARDVAFGGANGYCSGVRQDTKHPGLTALVVPEGCTCPKCTSKFTKATPATINIQHNKKNGKINWSCVITCPKCGKRGIKKCLNLVFDGQPEKLHEFQENMDERGKREMAAAYKKAMPLLP